MCQSFSHTLKATVLTLHRKGRSKGFFGHAYKAVKDESDMVPSAQDLKNISLSFDSGDILGDGSVMKSIVEEGADPPVFPVFGDDCVTHFVGTLPDGSIFNDTLKRDQPFKFRLGAEHVLEGLLGTGPSAAIGVLLVILLQREASTKASRRCERVSALAMVC